MMSYERSCRLCLTDLNEVPVDCSTIPELHETIKVLFDVQIYRSDNIRGICNRCLDYVMGYRALKKKITECQKIIQDYEEVRRKVMETRNLGRVISIKEEIIDVDAYECRILDTQSSHRIRPKAVTDSDINDILAIVHDKSMPSAAYKKSSIKRQIKIEPTSPPQQEFDKMSPFVEPTSSTSRDHIEKSLKNDTISLSPRQDSPLDTAAETVSSSVQTPIEIEARRHSERMSARKRQLSTSESPVNESGKKATRTKKTSSLAKRPCNLCSLKFKTTAGLKSHIREKHKKQRATSDGSETSNNILDRKEEDSISSSGSRESSIRKSARQAKFQALKKISPNPDNSAGHTRSTVRDQGETPNNSIVEPQHTSTPVVSAASNAHIDKSPSLPEESIKLEDNTSPSLGNSTFSKSTSLNKSDKKRIITITLVRTKDSLNFRYCDQFKRNIDFNTVSPDELEDIRKSLMIPDIWANLREAFKNSPPDASTIEQLTTILGDEFVL